MTRRLRIVWVWAVAVSLIGLGAAAQVEVPRDAKILPLGEPGTVWESLEPGACGGTLHTSMFGNPQTWNPLTAVETATTTITNLLYHGLVTLNPITADVEPALARSWEVFDDGLRLVFHLRRDVLWSDGEPFTADDVVFTFQDFIANPDVITGARDSLRLPDGDQPVVAKVDTYTVEVTLSTPYRPLLTAMGKKILPRHKWASLLRTVNPDAEPEAAMSILHLGTDPGDVVGTGPYVLESYLPDQAVVLRRNPHYYVFDGRGARLPYYDRRVIRIESSSDLSLLQFLNGELDVLEPQPPDLPLLVAHAAVRGYSVLVDRSMPIYGSAWIGFNQDIAAADSAAASKQTLYRDVRFRQAFARLVDRQGMIDAVFHGLALPQWSPLSMGSPFYAGRNAYGGPITEDGAVTFPYDPGAAGKALSDLGLEDRDGDGWREDPNGARITFHVSTVAGQSDYEGQCLILQDAARRVGLDVRYEPQDADLLLAGLFGGSFDIVLLGFNGGVEPNILASAYTPCGRMHVWKRSDCAAPDAVDQDMVSLFRAGASSFDLAEAFAIYSQMQKEAATEADLIYTVYPMFRFAYYDYVGNAGMANPNGHPSAENGFAADIAFDRRLAP